MIRNRLAVKTPLLTALLFLIPAACNLFEPSPFVPVEFNGLHEFDTADGSLTLRVVFEDGYVTQFVDQGQQKPVLNASPVAQVEGYLSYVGYSGWMQPFPDRAVEQWNVSFSGELNGQTGDYDGTLVLRLVSSEEEFAHYPASFRKVPE